MTKAKTKHREATPDLLQAAGVEEIKKADVVHGKAAKVEPRKVVDAPKKKVARQEVAVRSHQPPADVAPNMLLVVARAAADPSVNPEKMRALLDMQKEIMAEEARIAFTEAYIKLQDELPVINAKGRIEIEGKAGKRGQNTPYATFNEINRVTKPILRRHGFAMWFEPDAGPDGRIIMRGHLDHDRGHGKACVISLPLENSGSKNNVQGVGSSISYGKRYAAIALLNLVSEAQEDKDDDGAGAGKKGAKAEPATKEIVYVTPKQVEELKAAIEGCGVGLDMVYEKYGIADLKEVTTELFPAIIKACATFKANNKGRANG